MIERTEELGLAARLPIQVGGRLVEIRTLNLEESEEWLAKLAEIAAGFDLPDQANPSAALERIAQQPPRAMLEMVQAYDVDGRLPKDLRRQFTQAELYAALKAMVRAEAPFLADARSMVAAFGPQLQAIAATVLWRLYEQASSTNGHSPIGALPQDASEPSSLKNGFSSSGATDSAELDARPTSKPSGRRSP